MTIATADCSKVSVRGKGRVEMTPEKFEAQMISETLVDKLLESFDELDRCISVTRQILSQKEGVPGDVINRVNQYSDIVAKQRSLADELRGHLLGQNWEEVGRHVKLINGLSAMIRDDAQAILSGAYAPQSDKGTQEDEQLV